MDGLREGVSLRGMGGRDPKLEYQREGYALFEEMNQRIDMQAVDVIYKFVLPEPLPQGPPSSLLGAGSGSEPPEASGSQSRASARADGRRAANPKGGKIGRNAPCTCGSGRKYKKCCGAL
jgi:preprotein translocase subunit SecA